MFQSLQWTGFHVGQVKLRSTFWPFLFTAFRVPNYYLDTFSPFMMTSARFLSWFKLVWRSRLQSPAPLETCPRFCYCWLLPYNLSALAFCSIYFVPKPREELWDKPFKLYFCSFGPSSPLIIFNIVSLRIFHYESVSSLWLRDRKIWTCH